jgi:hypothetical protein
VIGILLVERLDARQLAGPETVQKQ